MPAIYIRICCSLANLCNKQLQNHSIIDVTTIIAKFISSNKIEITQFKAKCKQ